MEKDFDHRDAASVMLQALYEAHDMILAPDEEWRERVLDKIRNAISVATKAVHAPVSERAEQ